jgi:hypothetical protein
MSDQTPEQMLRDEIEKIKASASLCGLHPWRTNTKDKTGEDWLVCSFGNDHDGSDYIVTTDGVPGMAYESDGAKAEAEHVALCSPLNMGFLAALVTATLKAFQDMKTENERLATDLERLAGFLRRMIDTAPADLAISLAAHIGSMETDNETK